MCVQQLNLLITSFLYGWLEASYYFTYLEIAKIDKMVPVAATAGGRDIRSASFFRERLFSTLLARTYVRTYHRRLLKDEKAGVVIGVTQPQEETK